MDIGEETTRILPLIFVSCRDINKDMHGGSKCLSYLENPQCSQLAIFSLESFQKHSLPNICRV